MKYIKKIYKPFIYIISIILIANLFITILSYFNIIGTNIINIFKILTVILSTFIGGYKIGKISSKKGWLEGLKLSFIITILFILLNIIIKNKFKLINIIYYLIIIISTTLGSMIGINKKIH